MRNRRAKSMAGATVLGLGALGGVAMSTNHGLPASSGAAGGGSTALLTNASGTAQPAVANASASTRPPIVTRASGGAAPTEIDG